MSVAPFVRLLKPGKPLEAGKDVTAVQRALRDAGVLKKPVVASAYAENTWEAVGAFQALEHLTVDKVYGKTTHAKLAPHFDAYGRWLLAEALQDQKPDYRQLVANTAWWYYGQRFHIPYSQGRPIPTVYYGIKPPSVPKGLDCSGLVITCYWVNGLVHKLGELNSHGYGNTWSLAPMGTHVSIASVLPGDLVFYGNCSHVAIVVSAATSTRAARVISMGSYPMGYYPVNYRSDIWGVRRYL